MLHFSNLPSLVQLPFFFQNILVLENILSFILCLFIIPTVKRVCHNLSIQHMIDNIFCFFFNFKLFLICFFNFFFVKHPNKFFACKIRNKKCLRSSTFNFCKNKNFFRPIWNIAVCENVFIF